MKRPSPQNMNARLVARFIQIEGYRCLSLMRALGVVKCQFAVAWLAFRSCSQAAISSMMVCLSGIRRSRHWDDRTPSSDSARSSQLPCFGVCAIQSARPAAWLQRPERPRRVMLAVDVEIILDQDNGPGVGEVDIGQVFQDVSVVHGGMAIGDFDMAPAFERRKHHEEVGGAVALVFVIATGRASRLHRDRQARFGKELLGGLVQAHQRAMGIPWPRVDGQHIFHGGYERAIGLRRDDPALPAMGLENVFFSARPIVESLARSTIWSSTTFFSNSRKVQRARPLGGLEQASAISLASFSPSKILATAGAARCLRLNTASKPSSTSCFRTR